MALTAIGKNFAIQETATKRMNYVNLATGLLEEAGAATSIGGSKFEFKTASPLINTIVIFTAVTSGVEVPVVGRPYYVKASAKSFELTEEEGSSEAILVAGAKLEIASTKLANVVETNYLKRLAAEFTGQTAAKGVISASKGVPIKVPALTEVQWAMWFNVNTKPTKASEECFAVNKLTAPEHYTEEGTYELTSDKLEASPTFA